MLRMYALIGLCYAASCFAGICHWSVCVLTAFYMLLGCILEYTHRRAGVWGGILAVIFFAALTGMDILRHIGIISLFQNSFLNLLWSIIAYRILCHDRTMDRVQVGILAIVPLSCVAFELPALGFIAFLVPYLAILFSFLASQSLELPTTGCVAYSPDVGRRKQLLVSKRFWLMLSAMGILAFASGSFLFLVIPRYDAGAPRTSTVGGTDGVFPDVDLRKTGEIDLDPTLVFTADVPPKEGPWYWIVEMYDVFDGSRWSKSVIRRRNVVNNPKIGQTYHLEFVRPWNDRRLPNLDDAFRLVALNGMPPNEDELYLDTFNNWYRYRPEDGAVHSYAFEMADDVVLNVPRYAFQPGNIWPNRNRAEHRRVIELAERITEGATTVEARADRISAYLRTHYEYSLERPVRDGAVVEDFLFEQRFGHCEMFSTAMAVLSASLGMHVGTATGFSSSEYRDGRHLVRAAHAHSWVVVFLEDGELRVYDPTPSGAAQVRVNWIQRVNDWFVSYKSAHLYAWIKANWRYLIFAICALILFAVISREIIHFIRRRLGDVSDVRRETWHEFIETCKKMPHSYPLVKYTYEEWYSMTEDGPVRTFVRANIGSRFVSDRNPTGIWGRFMENHRMIRALGRAGRALRGMR